MYNSVESTSRRMNAMQQDYLASRDARRRRDGMTGAGDGSEGGEGVEEDEEELLRQEGVSSSPPAPPPAAPASERTRARIPVSEFAGDDDDDVADEQPLPEALPSPPSEWDEVAALSELERFLPVNVDDLRDRVGRPVVLANAELVNKFREDNDFLMQQAARAIAEVQRLRKGEFDDLSLFSQHIRR
jgi:hypothetical protein